MKRPAALFGFSILATVIAIALFGEVAAYVLFASSCLLCVAAAVTRNGRPARVGIAVCAAVCLAFLSFETQYKLKYLPAEALNGKTCTVVGTAEDFPYTSGDYTRIILSECTFDGKALGVGVGFYGKELPDIRPGDRVTVKGAKLSVADKNDKFFLHSLSNNMFFTVFSGEVSCESGKRSGIEYSILSLRRAVSTRLKLSLSADAYPIADALITGNQSNLSEAFSNGLQTAGASHIFAVSGMHLTVWTIVLFFLFGSSFGARRTANAVGLFFVVFFIIFTGKSPSVLRAGIMLAMLFIGNILRRPTDALNSLGAAVALCVLFNPFYAGNVSFLLSGFATAAVIVFSDFAIGKLSDKTATLHIKAFEYVKSALVVSAFVIVLTLPVTAYFFGGVSLLSGISSIICTIPAEGVMMSGALGALLFGTGHIGGFVFYVCERLCDVIIAAVKVLSKLDFFVLPLDSKLAATLFIIMMLAVAVSFMLFRSDRKRASLAAAMLCLSLFLTAANISAAFRPPQTEIFISGTGGDILISENNGAKTVVIGLSGTYDSVTAVKNELAKYGRKNADLLILPKGVQNKPRFLSDYSPTETINSDGTSSFCDKDTVVSQIKLALSDDTTLTYTRSEAFCGCLCESGNTTTAFVFSGKNHSLPNGYLTADCIIFKNGIPENAKRSPARKIFLSSVSYDGLLADRTDGIRITIKGGVKDADNQ